MFTWEAGIKHWILSMCCCNTTTWAKSTHLLGLLSFIGCVAYRVCHRAWPVASESNNAGCGGPRSSVDEILLNLKKGLSCKNCSCGRPSKSRISTRGRVSAFRCATYTTRASSVSNVTVPIGSELLLVLELAKTVLNITVMELMPQKFLHLVNVNPVLLEILATVLYSYCQN